MRSYPGVPLLVLYDHGKADIETEKWWQALKECCGETREFLTKVGTISFSVTTPGLVAMDENGNALGPAILMLDGRSHKQAEKFDSWLEKRSSFKRPATYPFPEALLSALSSG